MQIAESQVILFDYRSEASVAEALRGDRDTVISQETSSSLLSCHTEKMGVAYRGVD